MFINYFFLAVGSHNQLLSVFFTLVASKAFEADDFFWRFEALADFSLESANSIWRLSLRGWDSNPGRLTSFFPEEFMAPAKLAQTNPTRINPTEVDKLQLEGTFIRSRLLSHLCRDEEGLLVGVPEERRLVVTGPEHLS